MDKRYNYHETESALQKKWLEEETYTCANNPGPLYSIDTPPPTISGSLHIGHIFSYTHTDILARYQRMSGNSVFYPFGFDDNGLPTERYVEKKRGVKAHQIGRSAFIQICLEETKKAAQEFTKLWQRIGLSADWRAQYSTISPSVRKISQTSFIALYQKGFIYRKTEPTLYCPFCRTAVAQAELDDTEQKSFFNDILFQTKDGQTLTISTTRPELLSSCVALFYHPDDTRYQSLHHKKAIVPLYQHYVPILPDEAVDSEKGTGLVMCCTFGDTQDIAWYKAHSLPYRPSLGSDGRFLNTVNFITGMKTNEARTKIIELLKGKDLLKIQQPITHTVRIHERCKKEIEYLVLPQWFISLLPYKDKFLAYAEKISWYPSFMKTRYINWVENLSWDWCISRQRFYGIPFPVWHCTACNEIILAHTRDLPIDPQEVFYQGACPACRQNDTVQPDTDVMDTWNTSSLSPYICALLYDPNTTPFTQQKTTFLPMNMRPQAHDIIRTWAFYTIIKTWMHEKTIPWHEIVISGHVLSEDKEKLSKSKNNTKLDPQYLLDHYAADAIRYWTSSGTLGHDIHFSEQQLKIGNKLITKLWNAFRFIYEHINTASSQANEPTHLYTINEWILHEVSQCFTQYQHSFAKKEFGFALEKVEQFFWHIFCDNYLELIKHMLFNPTEYSSDEVIATHWTLHHLGMRILQLYAPFMPYITEKLYELLYQSQFNISSLHQTKFNAIQHTYQFSKSHYQLSIIVDIISEIRKLKTMHKLSLKTSLKTLTLYSADPAIITMLEKQQPLIKGITQADALIFSLEQKPSRLQQINNEWHAVVSYPASL